MGRQAYLTRLALGRSPFEEPELTESGEFIIGSHAHDLDNQVDGYVQQFDEKGHPENRVAKVAAKEFRRAKNDVLETIGVVTKKNKQESRQRMRAEKEKLASLVQENSYGPWLKAVEPGVSLLLLWWLMSLRRRFQTFRSFSTIPLSEIIKSEIRCLGPLTFLSSGLLAWLATMPVASCRHVLVEMIAGSIISEVDSGEEHVASRQRDATRMNILCQTLDFALFTVTASLLMFSDLQILHLIPPLAPLKPSSLIPFTRWSPICIPRVSGPLSARTLFQAGVEICKSPFLTLWLYDHVRYAVDSMNYRIVSATVPRPDLPDKLSKMAARKGDEDEDTILGLWLIDGPTLLEQIQNEAEILLDRIFCWTKWVLGGPISTTSEDSIQAQSVALERQILLGSLTVDLPNPTEGMAREIRRIAARLAWEEQHQAPPDDLDAWIGLPPTPGTSSTNTPEPEELMATVGAEDGGEVPSDLLQLRELSVSSPRPEPFELDDQSQRFGSAPNLGEAHDRHASTHSSNRRIIDASEIDNSDSSWENFLESYQRGRRAGLRATANVNATDVHQRIPGNPVQDRTLSPSRPAVRWPSEDSSSLRSGRSRSRQREREEGHGGIPRHRVTSLSNYPADAFAYHASVILTTIMMLPFESLYLRALATGFLASPAARPGAAAVALGIGADVRSLQACFGGEGGLMGKVRYGGVILLIVGLQTLIRAGIWGTGTKVAIWFGRSAFGWGR